MIQLKKLILVSHLKLINLMNKFIIKNKKIRSFKGQIRVSGDKSLSLRWVLLSSIASGVSKATNLLMSEDVIAAISAIKKLGIKVKIKKKICKIFGKGINGYSYRKNIIINAKNSGTLGRLLLGLLIDTPHKIKLIGDKSLSRRDFKRIAEPLSKFGAKFSLNKNKGLPLTILGTDNIKSTSYIENRGSAQCKSSVMLAAIKGKSSINIKAKKSRNHTELLFQSLKLPIKIKKSKSYDFIKIDPVSKISSINYKIPSHISSATFFMVLTSLSKNSALIIKDVNINPSRIGAITILKKMGVKIFFLNKRTYKGEKIADLLIKSCKKIKPINCPAYLNSGAIDEFLVIFLVAAKASGVSYFKDLAEMNQKESPRLIWGSKILNKMGIKTVLNQNSIKIYGNPNIEIKKKIIIKNYLKDHRVFMTSVIAAYSFGGQWEIHNKDSINTSFPTFLEIIKDIENDSI